jgi:two-component system, NarL family, response regulator LiaR
VPSIRVALVNDYEIVLEGLRGLVRPYDPEIRVVELDVSVRGLASDAANGAIVVFSFSNDAAVAHTVLDTGAQGFISKALPATQVVEGIRAAAHGERVMLTRRSQRAAMPAELRWPGREVCLTERGSELLALLPTGMTNRGAGGASPPQRKHDQEPTPQSLSKLKVRNRIQAASVARSGVLGENQSRNLTTGAN